ncbi:MAG: isochorismatase family protein [Roseibium sp.]|uniref:cysteine hydrolase family protein n=1 Tax=Roseibium sp. TaxID=1936156 RepID=UPI003D9C5A55
MIGLWSAVGLFAVVLAGLVLYTFKVMRKIGTPTRGDRIDPGGRPNAALLVIDVQEDFTRSKAANAFEPGSRDAAIADINQSIASARAAGTGVVFIKHVFRDKLAILLMKMVAKGVGTPGREGLRIDPALETGDAPVFEKSVGDAFSSTTFEDWLATRNVGRLTLVGLDSCHCVQLTAKGALSRGYQVEIRETGTLTATPQKWGPLKRELGDAGAVFS